MDPLLRKQKNISTTLDYYQYLVKVQQPINLFIDWLYFQY